MRDAPEKGERSPRSLGRRPHVSFSQAVLLSDLHGEATHHGSTQTRLLQPSHFTFILSSNFVSVKSRRPQQRSIKAPR